MFRHLMLFLVLLSNVQAAPTTESHREHVILLHGLCRTAHSMTPVKKHLTALGYTVHNVSYKSRSANIPTLSERTLSKAIIKAKHTNAKRIHFVTHSLGGILVRDYLSRHEMPELGNVVMLAPPNRGSEVVDKIGHWKLFKWINGPAGCQLGTSENGFIAQLPEPDFPMGVITGTRSFNWINSCMIPGTDDGKVSIKSTQLDSASCRIVPATHTFIMKKPRTKKLIAHFLKKGCFPA